MRPLRFASIAVVGALLASLSPAAEIEAAANSQTLILDEDFQDSLGLDNWVFSGTGTARLGGAWEPVVTTTDPALLLTENVNGQTGFAQYDLAQPTSAGLDISFRISQWNGTGADGISFFLKRGDDTSTAAGAGGSRLGYGPGSVDGISGALIGIGFDRYGGNAAYTTTSGSFTCPSLPAQTSTPNTITLRGPGQGQQGYCRLAASEVVSPGWDSDGSATLTSRGAGRLIRVKYDTEASPETVEVWVDGVSQIEVDAPSELNAAETFKFGFTAGTGGSNNNHSVWDVVVQTVSTLPGPSIDTSSLPPLTANEAYSTAIQATGGVNPLSFSVSSGSLPPGLTLSSAGILSGTPTTAGNYSFTVTVADAQGTPLTDSQPYSVSVSPRLLASSEGRDFFVTFDANLLGYEDTVRSDTSVGIPQFAEQWLYLSGEPNTVVTVHYPPLDPVTGVGATTEDFTIPSSGVVAVDASSKLVVKTVTGGELDTITSSFVNGLPTVSNKSELDAAGASASNSSAFNAVRLQVKSEGKKVAVYGAHLQDKTSDAFSAIPTQSLGTRYRAVAWDHMQFTTERPSRISVIATQPGTTEVTITPPANHDGLYQRGTGSFTIELDRGEVYSVTGTTTADGTTFGDDVTGTLIVSDKSVVVSSGNECAQVGNLGSCDHLVQYMPPVTAWGDSYILASSINSTLNDRYRVVADTDGTTLSLNGSPVLSGGNPVEIDAGEYYQFEASAARAFDVLETNNPVLVAKFIAGGHSNRYFWNYTGDPSLTVVTPTLQFLDSYKVSTPSSGFEVHSINVVFPTAEAGSLTITDLDSSRGLVRNLASPGTNGQTGVISGTDYSFVRFDVPAGAYEVSADEGIGVYVEGFKTYDSYSYVGGMAFVDLVENPEGALAVQRELEPSPSPPPPPAPASGGGGAPAATPPVPTPAPTVTPRPRRIGPVPIDPTVLFEPFLPGPVPSPPPIAPTGRVGGLLVPIQTQVTSPTGFSLRAGVLNLGLEVQQDQGVVRQNNTGGTEIEVRKGSTAAMTGTGLLPRSTVQVFLPLQGPNAKEIARIPVDDTGAFSGEAVFATRANERPLPIGRQLLQVVSLDEDGQQSVVEMTVNIAQSAPAPEPDRTAGATPTLRPGQFLATNAGEPEIVTVVPVPENRQARVEGDGWQMAVDIPSANGSVAPSDEGGALLQLVRDETAVVSGSGFMPGTRADVWLFSEPTLLGTVDIDQNGEFTGEVNIDSNVVVVGEHTLQLQGVGEDGYVRAANLGVVVNDSAAELTTEEAAGGFLWWPWLLLILLALLVWFALWRYRRSREGSAR